MISDHQGNTSQPILHHRGGYITRNRGWLASYIHGGGRRFTSVPKRATRRFFASLLFVYGANKQTKVNLKNEDGSSQKMSRVFIRSTFPYLTWNAEKGGYKSLFFKVGFGSHKSMAVTTEHGTYEVLNIGIVADDALIPTLDQIKSGIAALRVEGAALTPDGFGVLERSLMMLKDANPEIAHDADKALIELYCIFQCNHSKAHKLLGKWSDTEKQTGDATNVDAFVEDLQAITFPLALGRHGYNPSFKNLDLDQVESELQVLMADLAGFDAQPFLNSGTLLGYFRDGRPIPHDDDFDLGILVKGDTQDEVAKNWRRFVNTVSQKFQIIDKGSLVALKLSNGVQVDLFASWIIDDKVYVHPYCWADVSADAMLPMGTLEIRGRTFAAPADPDAILAVNYGDSWRVPDPFWSFDYRESKKRFGAMLKKLKSTS